MAGRLPARRLPARRLLRRRLPGARLRAAPALLVALVAAARGHGALRPFLHVLTERAPHVVLALRELPARAAAHVPLVAPLRLDQLPRGARALRRAALGGAALRRPALRGALGARELGARALRRRALPCSACP